MAKVDRAKYEDGEELASGMSANRLKLLLRIVEKEQLEILSKAYPRTEIAKKLDISNYDVESLQRYWHIEQVKTYNSGNRQAVDIDVLANRLWLKIEPLVEDKIRKMLGE